MISPEPDTDPVDFWFRTTMRATAATTMAADSSAIGDRHAGVRDGA
jgi:hypothetical protein